MKQAITSAEMTSLDRKAAEQYGISSLTLMENAGLSVAEFVAELVRPSSRILICCGKGNNGGDGFVAARLLAKHGFKPEVYLLEGSEELKPDAKTNFARLKQHGVVIHELRPNTDWSAFEESLASCRWVVDAMLGIGITRPLAEPYLSAVAKINRSGKLVASVDIPSGLNADTGDKCGAAIKADHTLTLGIPKKGLYLGQGPAMAGQVHVVDIGLPKELMRPYL
ncbi:MAG: NAD(P)H-hydrate epimerase [Candidatus Omnitrophica bacterium]|nr:NAD(P)H-hydrate epimerase [Candidatus Omnitrophota bacterium]